MTSKVRFYSVLSLTVCGIMLLSAATVFFVNQPTRIVSQLEVTVSRIPIGIVACKADSMMGSSPDAISHMEGVLMNHVTMLTASNDLAKRYGEPQAYSLRTWKQDRSRVTVAVDADGKVAGHWAWSE